MCTPPNVPNKGLALPLNISEVEEIFVTFRPEHEADAGVLLNVLHGVVNLFHLFVSYSRKENASVNFKLILIMLGKNYNIQEQKCMGFGPQATDKTLSSVRPDFALFLGEIAYHLPKCNPFYLPFLKYLCVKLEIQLKVSKMMLKY